MVRVDTCAYSSLHVPQGAEGRSESTITTTTATSTLDVSLTDHDAVRSNATGHDSAMRVYVRIRPFNACELLENGELPNQTVVLDSREGHIKILDPSRNFATRMTYAFEHCFDSVAAGPDGDQEEVYRHVGRTVLKNTIDGYNGCIFAYGQTGSGKTHTMLGPSEVFSIENSFRDDFLSYLSPPPSSDCSKVVRLDSFPSEGQWTGGGKNVSLNASLNAGKCLSQEGIIPRLVRQLFRALQEKQKVNSSYSFRVEVEFYEIYNEKVFDLLSNGTPAAELRVRHQATRGAFVEGLERKQITVGEDLMTWLAKGSADRHTASTKMNDRSSRSHAILAIHVLQVMLDECNNTNRVNSKLNLVDLAGSERIGASGVEGLHFKESTKINLSLTALGRVIDALADASSGKPGIFCPYRDSNLTWLLMDSLGGNSKTSMVATVSPCVEHYEVTCQTLRYASRAKQIVNVAVVNEDPQVRQIKMLTAEVARLKQMLGNQSLCDANADEIDRLRQMVLQLQQEASEREFALETLREQLKKKRDTSVTPNDSTTGPQSKVVTRDKRQQHGISVKPKEEPQTSRSALKLKGKADTEEAEGNRRVGKCETQFPHHSLNDKTVQQLKYLRIQPSQDYEALLDAVTCCAFNAAMNYENMLQKNTMMINSHSFALRETLQKLEAKEWSVLASIGERLTLEYAKACRKRFNLSEKTGIPKVKDPSKPTQQMQDKENLEMEKDKLKQQLCSLTQENDKLKKLCRQLKRGLGISSKNEDLRRESFEDSNYLFEEEVEPTGQYAHSLISPRQMVRGEAKSKLGSSLSAAEGGKLPLDIYNGESVRGHKCQETSRRVMVGRPTSQTKADADTSTLSVPVFDIRDISFTTRLKSTVMSHMDAFLEILSEKYRLVETSCGFWQQSHDGSIPSQDNSQKLYCFSTEFAQNKNTPRKHHLLGQIPRKQKQSGKPSEAASTPKEFGKRAVAKKEDGVFGNDDSSLLSPRNLNSPKVSKRRQQVMPSSKSSRKTSKKGGTSSSDVCFFDYDEEIVALKDEYVKRESEINEEYKLIIMELQKKQNELMEVTSREHQQQLDSAYEEQRKLREQLSECQCEAESAKEMKKLLGEQMLTVGKLLTERSALQWEQLEAWSTKVNATVKEFYQFREKSANAAAALAQGQLKKQLVSEKGRREFTKKSAQLLMECLAQRETFLREEERERLVLTARLRHVETASECCAKFSSLLIESHKLLGRHCVAEHKSLTEHFTAVWDALGEVHTDLGAKQKRVGELSDQLNTCKRWHREHQLRACLDQEAEERRLIAASQKSECDAMHAVIQGVNGVIRVKQKCVEELRAELCAATKKQQKKQLQSCLVSEAEARTLITTSFMDGVNAIRVAFKEAHASLTINEDHVKGLHAELDTSERSHHRHQMQRCLESEVEMRKSITTAQRSEYLTICTCFNAQRSLLRNYEERLGVLLAASVGNVVAGDRSAQKMLTRCFHAKTSPSAIGSLLLLEQFKRCACEELRVHTVSLQNYYCTFSVLRATNMVQHEYEVTLTALENHYAEELSRVQKENKELRANVQILRDNLDFQVNLDQLQAEMGIDGAVGAGNTPRSVADDGSGVPQAKQRDGLGISGLISNIFSRVAHTRKEPLSWGNSPQHVLSQSGGDEDTYSLVSGLISGHCTPRFHARRASAEESCFGSALFPESCDRTSLNNHECSASKLEKTS
uniref:Putative kinesin n=1 Tax=Trypanosoma congolense (strain IL3000) TaxID=1068625 RepID=G0UYR8_TRYCI|nr:putative kinesin [Trypanosoma congolense IL3000]